MERLVAALRAGFAYLREHHPKKAALVALFVLYRILRRLRRQKSVKERVVLITGGGSGLGKNLGRRFAWAGARVVLWDINERSLVAAGKQIAQEGGLAWTYTCDISDRNAVYAVAQRVQREVGKVDILINNAGIVSGDYITDIPDEKVERTFRVNVLAHFWTIKAFLPAMLDADSGHIVTIASAAGTGGCAKLTDYCASKFAAVGLDESLRVELQRRGANVRTTCVCPYYINTGMFDGVHSRFSLLLPILSEDYAAEQIMRAVRTEEAVLIMPRLLHLTPLLRFLLPVGVFDGVSNLLGINHSMDRFKGRQ
jgi:all-trans-retinol dehydrogenase (NAD+)